MSVLFCFISINFSSAYTMRGNLWHDNEIVETFVGRYGSQDGDYEKAINDCVKYLAKKMDKLGGDDAPEMGWYIIGCPTR